MQVKNLQKPKLGSKLKLSEIPKEWQVVSLIDLAEDENDVVAGPFGSNLKVSDYRPEGAPIIRLQNIERNKFVNKDIKYVSTEKAEELSYHSYLSGDLVLAKLGDPIGKTCTVPPFMKKGIVVADVVRIRLSPKKAVGSFIEYMLNSSICFMQLRKETIGSTRPRVNISQVRNLKLPLPSLPEQRRIASILSTVDEAIQRVSEAIARTERLKRGLMQRLLTRGIGHKEFKFSKELGHQIPKEWGVVELSNIFKLASGKTRPAKISENPTQDERFPVYGGNGILGYANQYFVNKEVIVIGRVGEYCGAIHKTPKFSWITDNALYTTEIINPEIELNYLKCILICLNLNKFKKKSGQPLMTQQIIYSIKIPLPSLPEQRKIDEILSIVDKKLELERNRKEKFERIKQGFMNDLLTGRKRVGPR